MCRESFAGELENLSKRATSGWYLNVIDTDAVESGGYPHSAILRPTTGCFEQYAIGSSVDLRESGVEVACTAHPERWSEFMFYGTELHVRQSGESAYISDRLPARTVTYRLRL